MAANEPALTIDEDDPFSLWRARAVFFAPRMRLDPHLINETIGILKTALSDDWLTGEATVKSRGNALGFRAHQIGNCLMAVDEQKVAELVELAEYLKFAATSPTFDALVAGIKNDYRSTRLQLGLAYRIKQAGASDVAFEPPVAGGRHGDIEFSVDGQGVIAECYVPGESERAGSSSLEAELLIKQAVETVGSLHGIYSVAICLTQTLEARARKEIVRCVREMALELERHTGTQLPHRFRRTECAAISVAASVVVPAGAYSQLVYHPDFPLPNHEPTMFMRKSSVPRNRIGVRPSLFNGPTGTHGALWLEPTESARQSLDQPLADPINLLVRKLEKKIAQTRRAGSWGRILIVETWMADQLHRLTHRDQAKLESLFSHHGMRAVLFAERLWRPPLRRHGWNLRILAAQGAGGPTESFFRTLVKVGMELPVPALAEDGR